MSDCEWFDGDCDGCRCFASPPCAHCLEHLDEDGGPLHPPSPVAQLAAQVVNWVPDAINAAMEAVVSGMGTALFTRPYGPHHPRLQSVADIISQLPADQLPKPITVALWHPRPDYLTDSGWWHWRPQCPCGDTSFGRRPHRWDCDQTPIWAQTVRDLDARALTGDLRGEMYRGWNPSADGWVQVGPLRDGDL